MALHDFDKLVMLLSADWFFPYWESIGIYEEEKKRRSLKEGCREIVKQFMSGAQQYWNIDFSEGRVRKTRTKFEALINRNSVATRTRVDELLSDQSRPIDEGTRWLLVSITEQHLDYSLKESPSLDPVIEERLRKQLAQQQHQEQKDFRKLSAASTSHWDEYLKSTTPDLPTMLADYLLTISSESKFDALWGLINTQLTTKQRRELLNWYRSVGHSLTGKPLRLSHDA